MAAHSPKELSEIYQARFAGRAEYRQKVWQVLCSFFARWIHENAAVLDLGCGHCEFINTVAARQKYAMDLNPDAANLAASGVVVLHQDCAAEWDLASGTLDAVFTSNFFEHLPDKAALQQTIEHALRCLRPDGVFILIGPNIKYVRGAYWDFYDHYIPLTELSMIEILKTCGFGIELCIGRFLPYTMSQTINYPIWTLRTYLHMSWLWPIFGKQFLVVARKQE